MESITSNIQSPEPVYVRIQNYPRSLQARAINYCYLSQKDGKNCTIFSQFLKDKESKKYLNIKDIIEKQKLELCVDDDVLLLDSKKPKSITNASVYIICETNDGTVFVPMNCVSLIKFN